MIRHTLREWSSTALKERGYRYLDNEDHTGLVVLVDSYGTGLSDPRQLPIEVFFGSHLPEIQLSATCAAIVSYRLLDVAAALRTTRRAFPALTFTLADSRVQASLWLPLWDDSPTAELDDSLVIGRAFDHFYYALCCAAEALNDAGLLLSPVRTASVLTAADEILRNRLDRES